MSSKKNESDVEKTNFRKVFAENEVREVYKKVSKNEQGFYTNRIANFFLIGSTRAFSLNLRPQELTKKSNLKFPIFNISTLDPGPKRRTLVDKEKFWRLFRVMAYATNIKNAGTDENKKEWKESHQVILEGSKCCKVAEEYFKGGWNHPPEMNFNEITNKDYPDDELLQELDLTIEEVEDDGLEEESSEGVEIKEVPSKD